MSLLSMPPTSPPEPYLHFVAVMVTAAEAVFGLPNKPDTVPGLVSSAARMLHTLVWAHPRWWLNALMVRRLWELVRLFA